jgi:hypothetical protein
MIERERMLAEADRAVVYIKMAAMLGRQGGLDANDLDGWQRRAALVSGIEHGNMYVTNALCGRPLSLLPPTLQAAIKVLDAFIGKRLDVLRPIQQYEIDAVTDAAATVAEQLKAAIEALR